MGELFLPKIFGRMIGTMDLIDQITPEDFSAFVKSLQNEEGFVKEFIGIVGEDIFRELVYKLGGNTVKIPKPQDIIKQALNYSAEVGE